MGLKIAKKGTAQRFKRFFPTYTYISNKQMHSAKLMIVMLSHKRRIYIPLSGKVRAKVTFKRLIDYDAKRIRGKALKVGLILQKKMFSFNFTSFVPLWPQGDSNNQFIYYISGGYILIYFLIFFISYASRRREVLYKTKFLR